MSAFLAICMCSFYLFSLLVRYARFFDWFSSRNTVTFYLHAFIRLFVFVCNARLMGFWNGCSDKLALVAICMESFDVLAVRPPWVAI